MNISINSLKFVNGVATIKNGRRIVGKIIDRLEVAKSFTNRTGKPYPYGVSKQYPVRVEVKKTGGSFDCVDLDEGIDIFNKYSN